MDCAIPEKRTIKACLAAWAPFHAGAEVAAERLAVGLREAGHDVFVLVGTDGQTLARMRDAGLRCIHVPLHFTDKWRWWRYAAARKAVGRLLAKERPDLVHANDLPTSHMVSEAARRLGIPRVCHHRWIFEGPAIDWLNKFGAQRHLFVSHALMNQMAEKSPTLRSSDRVVVYDGLPLPPVPTQGERCEARRELGLPQDKAIVTFAGQIIERKGIADLIQAWALLPSETRAAAELVVVGEDLEKGGEYRHKMEQLANETEVPARFVRFQKNVGPWLIASDIAAVPSHVEPLGNATLEAMSFAIPVIGGAVGGIPEMVLHETTGLLVPPRNPKQLALALQQLLADPARRQQFGRAGRIRCEEKFSAKAHADNVLCEYRCVLAKYRMP